MDGLDDLDDLMSELEGLGSPQKQPKPAVVAPKPAPPALKPVAQSPPAGASKSMGASADLEDEIDGLLDGLDDPDSPDQRKAASPTRKAQATSAYGDICTGVCLGSAEEQGNRPSMEDRYVARERFFPSNLSSKISSTRAICGVFDGHSGSMVSDFAAERLPELLEREPWFKDANKCENDLMKKSLENSFVRLDEEILARTSQGVLAGGSTANVALVVDGWLHCANLGDARAVLSRGGHAMPLSVDHKPDVEAEKSRIENASGKVEWRGCWRVMTNNGGAPRGLAVSRAFGDMDWKVPNMLVESAPDVMSVELNRRDEFVIVGCDGVWDVLQNQDAVDIARSHLTADRTGSDAAAKAAAQEIASRALELGSQDNVTVVVMGFVWA